MSGALLELDSVDAGYGPFRAIFGVSVEIRPGEAVAMLGANGAGKTTIARVCTGLVRPTDGTVRFEGRDATGQSAYRMARRGVAHAPEGRSVFATLTVEENLALSFRQAMGRTGYRAAIDRACDLFPRLGERRRQLAGTLSGGEQRMLALARVLVLKPKLLVADELSLGLAPVTVAEVYDTLARIKADGTAILVIEQHVHHALGLADQAVVLRHGEVTHRGTPAEIEAIGDQLLPRAEAPDAPISEAPVGEAASEATSTDTVSSGRAQRDTVDEADASRLAPNRPAGDPPAHGPARPARRRRPLTARRAPEAPREQA